MVVFHGTKQQTILHTFLNVFLNSAFPGTDVMRKLSHPTDIAFAQQQGRRHDEQENKSQTHIHFGKDVQGADQLAGRYHYARDATAQDLGDTRNIINQPVEDVSRVTRLPAVPPACHQMIEYIHPQFIVHASLCLSGQSVSHQ